VKQKVVKKLKIIKKDEKKRRNDKIILKIGICHNFLQ